MRNWGSPYNLILLLSFFLGACTNASYSPKESKNNIVFWGTDFSEKEIDFYSNNSFSQFIKDLIFDPICYYDTEDKSVQSAIIQEFKWKNERELVLTISNEPVFHDSQIFSKRKGRPIQTSDIIHSIQLFKEHSKYSVVKEVLEDITFSESKNEVIFHFANPVNTDLFMEQLAVFKIPVVPKELIEIKQIQDYVGTGLYAVDEMRNHFIFLSIFKNHPNYRNSETRLIPEKHIIHLALPQDEVYQEFTSGVVDGILTNDISPYINAFQKNSTIDAELFIRKEDQLTFFAISPEDSIPLAIKKSESIKRLLAPDAYNLSLKNNQLITYFSEIEFLTSENYQLSSIYFDRIEEPYKEFILQQIEKQSASIKITTENPDVIVYSLPTPSNQENFIAYLNQQAYSFYYGKTNFPIRYASYKIYQKASYILTREHLQFLNETFKNRNNFSTLHKKEKR